MVRTILQSECLLNSCQVVQCDPLNAKRSSPKRTFGMGYVKMHGFHGNPLYMILDIVRQAFTFNHI